jgi:hypothetical protein
VENIYFAFCRDQSGGRPRWYLITRIVAAEPLRAVAVAAPAPSLVPKDEAARMNVVI